MIKLIRVELTRLRWRRAVVVLLAGCTLVTVVIFAGTAWSTRPISDSERQQAQEQVDRELAQPYMQRQIRQCEKRPNRYGVRDPENCADRMGPQVEWYVSRSELQAGRAFREAGLGVITILMGLLMLVGTTFAGADWNSGSMSNQLLFEPRRARVWLAKAAGVLAVSIATSAVLLAAFAGGLLLLARTRGLEVPPEVPGWMAASSGRAVLLIGAAAVGAYAVTMLVRSTVFTLGAMFAVVVGATLVMALLGISEAWFPNKNLGSVIWNGSSYYVEPPSACFAEGRRPPAGLDCNGRERLDLWEAARNLGALLVVAGGASVWSFRRRDVP
jgi:ABC-2 type transport system permease protein